MSENLEYVRCIMRAQTATVTFTKNNGERRIMECTLNLDKIPPSMWPKGTISESSSDQVRVFDVNARGWRSFNFKNVESVEFLAANGEKMGLSFITEK